MHKSHELLQYGIDLVNFNSIIKHLMTFLKYFIFLIISITIILIVINARTFFDRVKSYFYESGPDYFFILDLLYKTQDGPYYTLNIPFIILSSIGYFVLLIFLFLKILKKLSLNKKKHRINLLENKEVEETLFSVFVKNLPKLTDSQDLKSHLQTEYQVTIREVIMINDYTVLESLKAKLDEWNDSGEFTVQSLNSIKSQIEKYSQNIESSGTAIIIFENFEDRLIFFRKFLIFPCFLIFFIAKRIFSIEAEKYILNQFLV